MWDPILSQALRRMNNHKQRLNQMFLYQHFCSNDHSNNDIVIYAHRGSFFQRREMLERSFQNSACINGRSQTISDQIFWMCNLSCTWAVTMSGQMLDQVVANLYTTYFLPQTLVMQLGGSCTVYITTVPTVTHCRCEGC